MLFRAARRQGVTDMLRTIGKCLEQNSVHYCDAAVAQARRLCALPIASEEAQPPSEWPSCASAVALLQRTRPSLLDSYRPLAVSGDGNCLYRSMSLLLYGTEQFHSVLRLRTAVEVLSNENWYNVEQSACRCPFKDETALILPNYRQFCIDTATDGAYADILTVYALSRAIDRSVQLFFPPLSNTMTVSPHTRLLNHEAAGKPLVVMWSTAGKVPSFGAVTIDHFVPLVAVDSTHCGVVRDVVVIDSDTDNENDAERQRDDSSSADEQERVQEKIGYYFYLYNACYFAL